MKMTKRDETALKESIAHWRRIVNGKTTPDESIGCDDCALCDLYRWNLHCAGCPVATHSGQPLCRGTPYEQVAREYNYLYNECGRSPDYIFDSFDFQRLAIKELEFLKGLLPKHKTKKKGKS